MSRYAVSLDYHLAIREVNTQLAELMKRERPDSSLKGYGDHSPIDECHAAVCAGLALRGDSGLIINEKYGTYVFIGDMISDIDPLELGMTEPKQGGECMHCGACLAACPTGILRKEGDSCLSAITQRKGELLAWEVELMRKFNTVWGCDVCQQVCPYNARCEMTPIEFFYRERISELTTDLISQMTKEQFKSRAFAWRGIKTVKRNLELLGY